jgi:hypothetical protein
MVYKAHFRKKMLIGFALIVGSVIISIIVKFIHDYYFLPKDPFERLQFHESLAYQYFSFVFFLLGIGGGLLILDSLVSAFINESIEINGNKIIVRRWNKELITIDANIEHEVFGYKPFKHSNSNNRTIPLPPLKKFLFEGREGLYLTDSERKIKTFIECYNEKIKAALSKVGLFFPVLSIHHKKDVFLIYNSPVYFKNVEKKLIIASENDYDIVVSPFDGGYIEKNINSNVRLVNGKTYKEHDKFKVIGIIEDNIRINNTEFIIDVLSLEKIAEGEIQQIESLKSDVEMDKYVKETFNVNSKQIAVSKYIRIAVLIGAISIGVGMLDHYICKNNFPNLYSEKVCTFSLIVGIILILGSRFIFWIIGLKKIK